MYNNKIVQKTETRKITIQSLQTEEDLLNQNNDLVSQNTYSK